MGLLRSLRSALAIAVRRQRFEEGVSEELRFHIDAYAEDLVRSGLSPAEAQRRARLELGSTEALKEELRAARGQRLLDELFQDLRYAMRRLHRGRVPAVAAVLALGVGVNLAVFSVIQAALLRPLPHPEPDRLVSISSRNIESGREHLTAPLDFFDFEQRTSTLARIAAYYPPGFTLTGGDQAERVSGARASSGIFEVFGVQPALGRGFLPSEDRAGAMPVAVISHALWMRRYHGDPAVIGQPIVLSGRPYTLVGVLPEGFHSPAMWPRTPEVWVPIGLDPNVGRRDARMLRIIGRLRPDVTTSQARAELSALATALAGEHPDTNTGTGAVVSDLHEQLTRDVRPSLYALTAAVLALLLVACGNAAGLLIGGALERQHEFATRLALGASRSRIIRQVVAENLIVGLIAAAAGFALASWAGDFLVGAATAAAVPRASEIRIGGMTFGLGAIISLTCTAACALVAAFEATRPGALSVVHAVRGSTPRRARARAILIGVEAALSVALLAGAALLGRSFYALQFTDPGFDPSHVLTTRISVPQTRYPAGPVLAGFYDLAIERVKALPGVEDASVVDWLPASGFGASIPFRRTDGAGSRSQDALAELRVVGLDYFRTVGIRLIAGRSFDRRDTEAAPPVIVINESLARAYFGSETPIGRRLTLERGSPLNAEVIGVVGGRARDRAAGPAWTRDLRIENTAAVDPARDTRPRHPHQRRCRHPDAGDRCRPSQPRARHPTVTAPAYGRCRGRSAHAPGFLRSRGGEFRVHSGVAGRFRHFRNGVLYGHGTPARIRRTPRARRLARERTAARGPVRRGANTPGTRRRRASRAGGRPCRPRAVVRHRPIGLADNSRRCRLHDGHHRRGCRGPRREGHSHRPRGRAQTRRGRLKPPINHAWCCLS